MRRRAIPINMPNSWCYDNNPSNCAKYGRLYTWEAAKQVCQSMGGGWRLPDTADWRNLVNYAGGGGVAGKTLRTKSGLIGNGNVNGTDDYGFSALPGGARFEKGGDFYDVGTVGHWWIALEYGELAHSQVISSVDHQWGNKGYVFEAGKYKGRGLSVRCVARN